MLLVALPAMGRAETVSQPAEPAADDSACVADQACMHHYRTARAFSKAGLMDRALHEYLDAYLRQPLPRLMFNIGRTHHRLKNPLQAIAAYQRFLSDKSTGLDEPLRERALEHLADALRELPPNQRVRSEILNGTVELTFLDPRHAPKTPLYEKWWLWTAVGAGAAIILGVGLGVGLTQR